MAVPEATETIGWEKRTMSEHLRDVTNPIGTIAMLETPRQFGAWIRWRRVALGLKQEELAFLVGVGRRFVAELEAGKPTCQIGKALAVAGALGGKLADAAEAGGGSVESLPAGPP
jgi:y4mF family transcriptional regulator